MSSGGRVHDSPRSKGGAPRRHRRSRVMRVWTDREEIFGRLSDQEVDVWYELKTTGR